MLQSSTHKNRNWFKLNKASNFTRQPLIHHRPHRLRRPPRRLRPPRHHRRQRAPPSWRGAGRGRSSSRRRSSPSLPWLCRRRRPAGGAETVSVPRRRGQTNQQGALSYLLVFLLQLGGLGLERGLVLGALRGPQLAQLLGDVADGDAGVLLLDPGAVLGAEDEEGGAAGGETDASTPEPAATRQPIRRGLTGASWGRWGPSSS